jgi:hypothetical protein
MVTPRSRRELGLDHGRVFIEVPRLMTDEELAAVVEAFAHEVRSRPAKPAPTPVSPSSPQPAFRKRTRRR